MSQKSSLHRVLEILKRLNDGEKLCVSRLVAEYEVSERTIQRDFKMILEVFDDFLIKEGECYRGYKKVLLNELLQGSDLMMLSNIVNVFDIMDNKSLISEKTKQLIQKSMEIYAFKSKPFEIIQNKKILRIIEHAIRFKKEIELTYAGKNKNNKYSIQPYKIIFLNENFYLLGKNINNKYLLRLRIALIKHIEYSTKIFYKNQNIDNFIDTMQTPWGKFQKNLINIELHISNNISQYFILKKYLPSQKIVKKFKNGDIQITYKVSDLKEIEELIIKWLPHLQIVEPKELKDKVKKELIYRLNALN